MKRIVIATATRAEYGLLKPLINKLNDGTDFEIKVVATGMHLSPEFGMTVREIEDDGISIDKRIEILLGSDTPVAISKSMGLAMISFSEYFDECKPDALIILGDRFETLAVACAATNARIPIFHIHGGEVTEGAIDEAFRHSITKMSYLHFASTEVYRKRIIQMGESPDRVFNVGALGVENALSIEPLSIDELETSLKIKLGDDYAVGTFHPVTLENNTAEQQIYQLIKAIERHPDINFIFTKSNADTDGRLINKLLEEYSSSQSNLFFVSSMGMKGYLSAIKYSKFVIGNSSSGLIEAPSYGIPTVDIGDRQKGRIAGETVIHCDPTMESIDSAIIKALDNSFRDRITGYANPYGNGKTSEKIIREIRTFLLENRINIKKSFYNIEL